MSVTSVLGHREQLNDMELISKDINTKINSCCKRFGPGENKNKCCGKKRPCHLGHVYFDHFLTSGKRFRGEPLITNLFRVVKLLIIPLYNIAAYIVVYS